LQLFFNFTWSIIFFCFHHLFLAVVDIILLWAMIVYMIDSFKEVKPIAAWLNIPYLLWVSFATVLTIAIWKLN
jgi:tryptophan-rich sensory protein